VGIMNRTVDVAFVVKPDANVETGANPAETEEIPSAALDIVIDRANMYHA
jgi:hypothetical protein